MVGSTLKNMMLQKLKSMNFLTSVAIFILKEMMSFIGHAKLKSGRYLKVVFPRVNSNTVFIITAYDLHGKAIMDTIERQLEDS